MFSRDNSGWTHDILEEVTETANNADKKKYKDVFKNLHKEV